MIRPLRSKPALPDTDSAGNRPLHLWPVALVMLFGFAIRLLACSNISIVNPDGPLYIHQARALYFGQWDQITSCAFRYFSVYPIFIAGAYSVFHDWIVAARSVSWLFGSLTLVPAYLLLRHFFERGTSALGVLVLASIPFLVDTSADVVRGPVCWFFLILGLNFFVTTIGKQTYRGLLLLSSASFLMAAWARAEAILFFVVSLVYLLCFEREKKMDRIACFASPVLVILAFVILNSTLSSLMFKTIFRFDEILAKILMPAGQYNALRASLADLSGSSSDEFLIFFLAKARNLVWLIALGALFTHVVKAFFYPFFFLFLLGLPDIKRRITKDRRIMYLAALSLASLVILYLHILETWLIYNRFLVIFLFPAFVSVGYGLEKTVHFIRSRFKLKTSVALVLLSFLMLAVSLPKNLKPREADKVVFKDIGELISKREGNARVTSVATSMHILRWTSFYANLSYAGAPCPQPYDDFKAIVGHRYDDFVRNLKEKDIRYFVWEEKHWPAGSFDFMKEMNSEDFEELGSWTHPDTGKMILFKVR